MAASNGRKTVKGTTRSTAKSKTSTRSSAGKKKIDAQQAAQDSALFHEIGLIALFAAMVLLFCCNFGIIGPVGDGVSSILFGLLGLTAYVLPVALFLAVAFWFANEGNPNAVRKLIAGVVLLVMLGVVCDLLTGNTAAMEEYNAILLYNNCSNEKTGGGILIGSFSFLLQHYLGTIGTVLLVILCSVISLILLTEKSLISSVKKGGSRVREFSREDAERRKEYARIRRENAEARREEQARLKLQEREERLRREEERARKKEERAGREERAGEERYTGGEEGYTGREEGRTRGEEGRTRKEEERARREEERARKEEERRLRAEEMENEKILRMERKVSGVILDTALPRPEESPVNDDMHEIVMPEAEIEEEFPASALSAAEIDYNGMQIRSVHQVMLNEEPADQDIPEPWTEGRREQDSSVRVHKDGSQEAFGDVFSSQESIPGAGEDDLTWEESLFMGENTSMVETPFIKDNDFMEGAVPTESSIFPDVDSSMEDFDEQEFIRQLMEEDNSMDEDISMEGNIFKDEDNSMDENRSNLPKAAGISGDGRPTAKLNDTQNQRPDIFAGQDMNQAKPPKKYMFPPISLLQKSEPVKGDFARELKETALHLQQTLATFGVKVTITDISQGPSVTRYELQPEQGVKVSKIVGLTDDIKLNLAATDIRIEAPIPGKAAVGIEVPNKENMPVALRDLLETEEFRNFPSNIAFAVGKDIGGKVVVSDIAKMPHMLIAGATGSGKSVCINTLIMSILYKANPDDVKLIMVDPKVVELSVYNGIPHLLIPVVTDPKKASAALHWGVAEMEDRYKKFADYNVRDLKGYNKKIESMQNGEEGLKKLPQIVIIVDELADLMMVCPGEVEESICRLAQLARAAGIHLIIATQRPSVDVITGLIKANMPSRAAFSVSSGVDSRTILDMVGAEKLLGKGDMLFYPQGYSKPARVQGAFVSDKEVSDVVDFLKNQSIGNTYSADIEERIKKMGTQGGGAMSSDDSDVDELFERAGRFIIDKDKASIGALQRALKIGFNRAARIMDQLCQYGVVSEEEGTKPRKILMSPEQFEQLLEEEM